MKLHKTIAKVLAFQEKCYQLGLTDKELKFEAVKNDKLIENYKIMAFVNGLKVDCFGFYPDRTFDLKSAREEFEKLSHDGKEAFLKQYGNFIVHHGEAMNFFGNKDIPWILKKNNLVIPSEVN